MNAARDGVDYDIREAGMSGFEVAVPTASSHAIEPGHGVKSVSPETHDEDHLRELTAHFAEVVSIVACVESVGSAFL